MSRRVTSVLLGLAVAGCGGVRLVVTQPPVKPPRPPWVLRAGAAERDITPPPGPPVWGSSIAGAGRLVGYRQRLRLRALVVEDRRGERIAVVQADLGGSSALLHRAIAGRLAGIGIGPDRLLLATTHTHAAFGGYFGAAFNNRFAPACPGFDERVLGFLGDRAIAAVEEAAGKLAPASIGVGTVDVEDVTRNRSRTAWESNFQPLPPPDRDDVDRRLTLLRVDDVAQPRAPIAVLALFAVHPTSAGAHEPLAHGDLLGVAGERLQRDLRSRFSNAVVCAFLNGAEGDVSPNWKGWPLSDHRGFPESVRLGNALASAAERAFESAGHDMKTDLVIERAYRELWLPGAATQAGRLCEKAQFGVPALAGAEDIRSPLHGWFGVIEGARKVKASRCQSPKKAALGWFQGVLVHPDDFVRLAPFQILAFGRELVLAAVPAEPTTETGRGIAARVRDVLPARHVAVVSHANDYVGYVATAREYDAQHYEGASTLYGPHTQELFVEESVRLAESIRQDDPIHEFAVTREFRPGVERRFWEEARRCRPDTWSITKVIASRAGITFEWRGPRASEACGDLPSLQVVCPGAGFRDSDAGPGFEVRHLKNDRWTARWTPPPGIYGEACQFVVSRPQLGPLRRSFSVP